MRLPFPENEIEESFNYGVNILKELISLPSVSPQGFYYKETSELLARETEKLGFKTKIIEVPKEYQKQYCKEAGENPRYIVYAYKGEGVTLHFNGHYDVVPGGQGWTVTDPFKPIIKENKLYGRGAIDMKGGIAATLAAMYLLTKTGTLPKNLRLELGFVPDEEIGGECGTGYLVEKVLEKAPDFVMIPEPSGLETPWHGHKGALWARITVKGVNAHASTPWLGVNAFMLASRLALKLQEKYSVILSERKTKYKIDPPEAASPTIMIGGVANVVGGGKTNQIPGEFEFTVDRRLIPEESISQAKWELESLLRWISIEEGRIDYTVKYENMMEPAVNEPGVLYDSLKAAAESLNVPIKEPHLCPGGLDLRYYTVKGSKVLSYGPRGETAHAPDEYIDLDEFRKLIVIYAVLTLELSGRVE